jgi:hypothetical protein
LSGFRPKFGLKRENFELSFFTLSDPIWVGDFGAEVKKKMFHFAHDFVGFWFFYHMLDVR